LKTGSPNILLNTVQSVLDNLPLSKMVQLSKLWEEKHQDHTKWKNLAKEDSDPMQITKRILGITALETVKDQLGDMDDSDNSSNYFVN
jgi:hypothetical protein